MKSLLFILYLCLVAINGLRVSNMDASCLACLCSLYGCPMNRGCSNVNCGPFFISRDFWKLVGKPTLAEDDPERANAYEDCTLNYECASRVITTYMGMYGKDCNRDGVTNCFDYMMIIHNGGTNCSPPLFKTFNGRKSLVNFNKCRLN